MSFTAESSATVHGLAGYFDSDLYGDARISINPETLSEGMFSWFPLYMPLRNPVRVHAGDRIEAHVWRCWSAGRHKVWYEWALSAPVATPVHNPNGRSSWVGM